MAQCTMHLMTDVYVGDTGDQKVHVDKRVQAEKIGKRARCGKIETLRMKASHCSRTNTIMTQSISFQSATA